MKLKRKKQKERVTKTKPNICIISLHAESINLMGINQTYGCLLLSCPERSISTAVYVLLYVSTAATVLLTVCGNLLIIISVCHFKQLHTPTNMLILSLAVSDFLVGGLVIPVSLIWMIESCWIFSSMYCVCFILISYFLTTSSTFNVALIAVDRYFALSKPFLYNNTVSLSTMCTIVICSWFAWLLYNIALQYFNGHFTSLVMCPGECFMVLDEVWSVVDLLLTFVFPCAVIIILYVLIFCIAKKHATAIRELNSHTRTQNSKIMSESMKSERKAAKVLGILVSVFLVCLFPYFVYSVLGNVIEIEIDLFQNVLMLFYLNSAINPIIYALFYPWFRRCVKVILTLQIFNSDSSLINVL
ncbi:trace amine-associated receptor 13c-like [Brachyhypopomus gauderio]|uniref:trace amine-associated receptor 13c-like n=1 Tax=Brachyhypopomus gauderio TaxID=698409 RepID=UPI0040437E22